MNDSTLYIIFITIITALVSLNIGVRYAVRYYLNRNIQNIENNEHNNQNTLHFNFDIIENTFFTNDEVCSICLSDLNDLESNYKIYRTKCNHFYHQECIDHWIHSHNFQAYKCPLCLENMY